MLGTVTALRRYPVKSMLGEDLGASDVSHLGLARDRRLAHGALPRDTEALRVLARHNRVAPLAGLDPEPCAGVYAEVLRPGRIRVGDAVRVRAASPAPGR
jgi:uncharacterized protein YcbX